MIDPLRGPLNAAEIAFRVIHIVKLSESVSLTQRESQVLTSVGIGGL